MGVPVVTMNYGGMAELVEDGKTGGLAKEATAEAVAEAIRAAMAEPCHSTLRENCEKIRDSIMGIREYCEILVEKYKSLQ